MVTIAISEEAHVELRKLKGELMSKNGKEKSFDDVIKTLTDFYKNKQPSAK